MGSQRAHILLPQELIEEIDLAVGPRGRSAFLVETARTELRRRKLLSFLRSPEPVWKEKNHPELANGTASWVKIIRSESDHRISATKQARKQTK